MSFTAPQWTLGERIRKLRKQRRLTQPQLAGQVGVTVDTVVQWEKGRQIQKENWSRLVAALSPEGADDAARTATETWLRGD